METGEIDGEQLQTNEARLQNETPSIRTSEAICLHFQRPAVMLLNYQYWFTIKRCVVFVFLLGRVEINFGAINNGMD